MARVNQPHGRPKEHVGVLVVRVRVERSGVPTPVMHVTRTLDIESPLTEVSATVDPDEVCDLLRQWLAEFRARAGADPPRPGHDG